MPVTGRAAWRQRLAAARAALHRLRRWLPVVAAFALLAGAPSAHALCTAALGCACTVNTSAATLSFGNYNPLGSGALTSASNIKVGCAGVAGLAITYKIHLGTGGATGFASRRLASGSNTLTYNLYTDSTYTAIWGDNTGGSTKVWGNIGLDVVGLSPPNTHWIYGAIPSGQRTAVPAASYTDTVTVTVTYY